MEPPLVEIEGAGYRCLGKKVWGVRKRRAGRRDKAGQARA